MTGRRCESVARGGTAAGIVLLWLMAAAGPATAQGGAASPDAQESRELAAGDKMRITWPADAPSGPRPAGKTPVLEDVMTRDQIIEEFGLLEDSVNALPGVPAQRTSAIPIPRTLPVNPGVLRFRPLQRIRQMVREELYPHFDLYLYVNKAPKGVWAQKMFIFERTPDGEFRQLFRWLASTGRERNERYFTTTPVGVFKLDPGRFREMYYSVQWGGVAMPFAMFIDFSYASRKSGIAIHGTRGRTENHLGRRASGGCIRLSVDNARMLYYLIRTNYAGMVPKFAYDRDRGHTSKTGQFSRDEDGTVIMEPGYRVLLIVDYVTN